MWKVKMLKTWARAEGIVQANDEVSVDEKTAKNLIENESAVLIFKPIKKRKVEIATVKPKERAVRIEKKKVVEMPIESPEIISTIVEVKEEVIEESKVKSKKKKKKWR